MKTLTVLKNIFAICVAFNYFKTGDNSPVFGKFAGKAITVLDTELYAFYGIPYAVPPVEELRFREPQPFQYENITYNATQKSPSCMQDPFFIWVEWRDRSPKEMSEDCLYLNVWVPATKPDGKPLATMVWIYGGTFIMGASNINLYDGAVLAAVGNVIVVTFNYRVNAFGFANFDQEDARGNMGLLDQVMALKWVQENIEDFGGDKNLVTAFGESAGSTSIAGHMISPLSKGLFQRAILQSGSNYMEYFAVNTTFNRKLTEVLSEELGCNNTDVLNCMKEVDAYKITSAEKQLIKREQILLFFHPQVGTSLLSDDPFRDIDAGKFHDVDVLIGEVKNEGSAFLVMLNPFLSFQNAPTFTKADAKHFIGKVFKISGEYLERIFNEYIENIPENDYAEILKQTVEGIGNGFFNCPILHLTEKLSQYNRRPYRYMYNHTRAKYMFGKWTGVMHSEEMQFVFGRPLVKKKGYTEEEILFSKRIIQLWTSFAKTGKPTYDGMEHEWKPFDKQERNSLSLTLGNIRPIKAETLEKYSFWKNLYKEMTGKMFVN